MCYFKAMTHIQSTYLHISSLTVVRDLWMGWKYDRNRKDYTKSKESCEIRKLFASLYSWVDYQFHYRFKETKKTVLFCFPINKFFVLILQDIKILITSKACRNNVHDILRCFQLLAQLYLDRQNEERFTQGRAMNNCVKD